MNFFDRKIFSQAESIIYAKYAAVGSGGILEFYTCAGQRVMALKIESLLNNNTFIFFHKEFLMNLLIERIEEFLPVGRIQVPLFDVEGKGIVIVLVQTLYDNESPAESFTPFGLTIID